MFEYIEVCFFEEIIINKLLVLNDEDKWNLLKILNVINFWIKLFFFIILRIRNEILIKFCRCGFIDNYVILDIYVYVENVWEFVCMKCYLLWG